MVGGRRKLLQIASMAIIMGSVWLPAFAADSSCKQLEVLLGISPQHREDVMAVIAPKLKTDLGVDLVAETMGSGDMVDRVAAQTASPRISIAHWDEPIGIAACDRGLCEDLDLSRLPNAQHLAKWAYSPSTSGKLQVLNTGATGVGFLYNADEFKKHNITPPTSWNDLTSKAYAGRLGLTAPQSTMGLASLSMFARLHGGSESAIDPGFAEAKAILANQNTIFTWSSEMSNLLQLGDLWIAVNSSNVAPALRANGLPIQFVWPKEGAPAVDAGVSIIKNSPCRDAAYDYLNLYFDPTFQATRILHGGALSPVPDAWAKMSKEQLATLSLAPDDLDKLVTLDWRAINRDRTSWVERWQREMH